MGLAVDAAVVIAPLALAYVAQATSTNLWGEVVASFPTRSAAQMRAWAAWPPMQLAGSLVMLAAAVLATHAQLVGRLVVVSAMAGLVIAVGLTLWPAVEHFASLPRGQPLAKRLVAIDVRYAVAAAVGLFGFAGGARYLRHAGQRVEASKPKAVERAASDTFGHADWMGLEEARALFDPSRSRRGGVVVGEADRVDQGLVASVAFEPHDRTTWGQGGTASPLVYDLSFGSTHGLVFAGSGAFKTVSVCVPTLLGYRGTAVTLDPSRELSPMLRAARLAMQHRVVAVDPTRPRETGFNVLDWLDLASPTATADIRTVVEWICGERTPTRAHASEGAHEFFRGRGKAMVEALLSDLLLDPSVRDGDKTLRGLASRLALPEAEMRSELDRIQRDSKSTRARHLAGQLKGLVKETFSGVYGNMSEQTEWLANPDFADLVSGSSFRTRELRDGKLDLFLNLSMKVLETTPALGRCILGALLNAVYEADGQMQGRVLFLLDEVARLGFMSSLTRARDAGRKYGISLVLLYQSEAQLAEQWGEDGKAAWFESVTWRSYSAIADVALAETISRTCGEHGVVTVSRGDTKGVSRRQPLARGTRTSGESENRSEQKRRLITSDEILHDMRTDEQIVFVRGRKPLRCGRAIYFRRPEMVARVGENRFGRAGATTGPSS